MGRTRRFGRVLTGLALAGLLAGQAGCSFIMGKVAMEGGKYAYRKMKESHAEKKREKQASEQQPRERHAESQPPRPSEPAEPAPPAPSEPAEPAPTTAPPPRPS